MAPIDDADTPRQPSESVYQLDLDWLRYVLVISFAWNMYRHRIFLACFISHCYTCIKTWVVSEILSSTILEKLAAFSGSWKICCWIHIRVGIYRICIVIHKSLVLDGSLHYLQCVTYATILSIFILFSMIWYCRIQSTAVSKERDIRWCGFRYSIPHSIGYVWNSDIDMDISTPSCSYCVWNRYIKKSQLVTSLMRERSLMQDYSEKQFYTVIIDI